MWIHTFFCCLFHPIYWLLKVLIERVCINYEYDLKAKKKTGGNLDNVQTKESRQNRDKVGEAHAILMLHTCCCTLLLLWLWWWRWHVTLHFFVQPNGFDFLDIAKGSFTVGCRGSKRIVVLHIFTQIFGHLFRNSYQKSHIS